MSSTNLTKEVSGSGEKRNPTAGVPIPWEDPVPLMYAVKKPFPVDVFPEPFRSYTKAVAEAMQVPVDMVAMTQLGVLGAVTMGKYTPHCPRWGQPTNMYVLIIADPSERKTPVIKALCSPIYQWQDDWNAAHKKDVIMSQMKQSGLDQRVLDAKKAFSKDPSAYDKLEQAVMDAENNPVMKYKDVIFTDATPAAIGPHLKQAEERAILITDEGGIFALAQGNRDAITSIDIYNKAYDGSPVKVGRISREGEALKNPLLTTIIMAQPVILEDILSNARWRGNGFVGRFMFSQPTTLIGNRHVEPEEIDPALQAVYDKKVISMLDDPAVNVPVRMTPKAAALWREHSAEFEKRLDRYNGDLVDGCGWYGKLEGKLLRVAGVLAVAGSDAGLDEFGSGDIQISADTLSGAFQIGDYLLAEYQAAFETGGRMDTVRDAEFLVQKMKDQFEKTGETAISRTDMQRRWNRFRLKEDRDKTLILLEEHKYIRMKDQNQYEFNPGVICD